MFSIQRINNLTYLDNYFGFANKYGIINLLSNKPYLKNDTFYIDNILNNGLFTDYIGKNKTSNDKILNSIKKELSSEKINDIINIINLLFNEFSLDTKQKIKERKEKIDNINEMIEIENKESKPDTELIDIYKKRIEDILKESKITYSSNEQQAINNTLALLYVKGYIEFYDFARHIRISDWFDMSKNNLMDYALYIYNKYNFINVIANKIRQCIDVNILAFLDVPFQPIMYNTLPINTAIAPLNEPYIGLYEYYIGLYNMGNKEGYIYQISDKQFDNSITYITSSNNIRNISDQLKDVFNIDLLYYLRPIEYNMNLWDEVRDVLSFNIVNKILNKNYYNYTFIAKNYFNALLKIINNDIPALYLPLTPPENAITKYNENNIKIFTNDIYTPIFTLQNDFILALTSYFKYYAIRQSTINTLESYDVDDIDVYNTNVLKKYLKETLINHLRKIPNIQNMGNIKWTGYENNGINIEINIDKYIDTIIYILNELLEYKNYIFHYAVSDLTHRVSKVFVYYLKQLQVKFYNKVYNNIVSVSGMEEILNKTGFYSMPSGYVSKKNSLRQDMDINSQFLNSDIIISNIRKCIYDR